MGITYADITVENSFNKRRIDARVLVDSGCVFFTVPADMAAQLGFDLTEVGTREVTLADGSRHVVPIVGPLRLHYAGRYCDISALVLGEQPLFGVVPMEMMDLVLDPVTQALSVNPASPFQPSTLAMSFHASARASAHGGM